MQLYGHYKKQFDLEMKMKAKNLTYEQLAILQEKMSGDGEWF